MVIFVGWLTDHLCHPDPFVPRTFCIWLGSKGSTNTVELLRILWISHSEWPLTLLCWQLSLSNRTLQKRNTLYILSRSFCFSLTVGHRRDIAPTKSLSSISMFITFQGQSKDWACCSNMEKLLDCCTRPRSWMQIMHRQCQGDNHSL